MIFQSDCCDSILFKPSQFLVTSISSNCLRKKNEILLTSVQQMCFMISFSTNFNLNNMFPYRWWVHIFHHTHTFDVIKQKMEKKTTKNVIVTYILHILCFVRNIISHRIITATCSFRLNSTVYITPETNKIFLKLYSYSYIATMSS